jgi:hypothetical protein
MSDGCAGTDRLPAGLHAATVSGADASRNPAAGHSVHRELEPVRRAARGRPRAEMRRAKKVMSDGCAGTDRLPAGLLAAPVSGADASRNPAAGHTVRRKLDPIRRAARVAGHAPKCVAQRKSCRTDAREPTVFPPACSRRPSRVRTQAETRRLGTPCAEKSSQSGAPRARPATRRSASRNAIHVGRMRRAVFPAACSRRPSRVRTQAETPGGSAQRAQKTRSNQARRRTQTCRSDARVLTFFLAAALTRTQADVFATKPGGVQPDMGRDCPPTRNAQSPMRLTALRRPRWSQVPLRPVRATDTAASGIETVPMATGSSRHRQAQDCRAVPGAGRTFRRGTGATPGARRGDGPPGGNCPASRTATRQRRSGKA